MKNFKITGVTTQGEQTEASIKAGSYDEALMQATQMVTEISTLRFAVVHNENI